MLLRTCPEVQDAAAADEEEEEAIKGGESVEVKSLKSGRGTSVQEASGEMPTDALIRAGACAGALSFMCAGRPAGGTFGVAFGQRRCERGSEASLVCARARGSLAKLLTGQSISKFELGPSSNSPLAAGTRRRRTFASVRLSDTQSGPASACARLLAPFFHAIPDKGEMRAACRTTDERRRRRRLTIRRASSLPRRFPAPRPHPHSHSPGTSNSHGRRRCKRICVCLRILLPLGHCERRVISCSRSPIVRILSATMAKNVQAESVWAKCSL